LQLAALFAALQALEQRALGQQLGLEAGGHGRNAPRWVTPIGLRRRLGMPTSSG
jgi:hypothetical protein